MISKGKKIMIIGAGWEQQALIETIHADGHSIIATNPKIPAAGFALAEHYYVKDSRDIGGHLRIADAHAIDAVITDNCDYSLYTAAVLASKLGLPSASIASAILSNDKFAQRQRCETNGIVQPSFRRVQSPEDLVVAAHDIGFPVIVKPVDSRGTFGVTIVRDLPHLRDAFYDAIDNSPSRSLICEKFIEGTLVTVDGFCFRNGHTGLAVASRQFENGPKPVTKEIIYPARFDAGTNRRLLANHNAVVASLGYKHGHTHGEYILHSSGEIYLVECTNRGGGVYTSSVIIPLLTGVNVNKILLDQSLGRDSFNMTASADGFMQSSIILTFLDFEVGRVIEKINIDDMQNKPYTVRFRSIYGENDMVESVENCASRHSMLVLRGSNIAESLGNLEAFKAALRVEYHS